MTLSNLRDRGTLRGTLREGGGGGTYDYNDLGNKPQINSVELSGNKSGSDLYLLDQLNSEPNPDTTGHTTVRLKALKLFNRFFHWDYRDLENPPYINSHLLTGNKSGSDLGLANASDIPGDFTGADGVNPGTSGLVPAPAASDDGKYLCGDGNWKDLSSSYHIKKLYEDSALGNNTTGTMYYYNDNDKLSNYDLILVFFAASGETTLYPQLVFPPSLGDFNNAGLVYPGFYQRYNITIYNDEFFNQTAIVGETPNRAPHVYLIYGLKF